MLRSLKSVQGFTIRATNGTPGTVREFLFDATSWEIRYLVVEPGEQSSGQGLLIAPVAFGKPLWQAQTFPVLLTQEQVQNGSEAEHEQRQNPDLQSTREIKGYQIQALDGEIGALEDLIVDDDAWGIHYVVVKTTDWQPEREVLLAIEWIKEVQWDEHTVHIDLPRERIRHSPEYNPADPVNREFEIQLYDFYGRPRPTSWLNNATIPAPEHG